MPEQRCIHRHTRKTHPNCFKKGLIQYNWWETKRICFLDIETSGLTANFDMMLTYSLKPLGGKVIYGVIEKEEIFSGKFDKRLVAELLQHLKNFDIIVTYNGTRFDVPFVRTRADFYRLDFPKFGEKYHWDLYFRVKSLYRLHRKSLEVVTKFLGIPGKTPVDYDTWFRARYGDKKALQKVLEHNKQDVIILEGLYERIKEYGKWIRKPM